MVILDGHEHLTAEEVRLRQDQRHERHWRRWGPYLAERQWGTAREDYSSDGGASNHFPHDHARSRAYRWGEDGIAGVSDNHGRLNIAFAFWNEKDPFLKERLFGLSSSQGNHGESIKEVHFHLDNTPHSYMKFLYKYPQARFPYESLVKENGRRSKHEKEYQIADTGAFEEDRYWDIFIEIAKETDDADELLFRAVAWNRGPERAPLHIIPQVWFRNTWAWGREPPENKPSIGVHDSLMALTSDRKLGKRFILLSPSPGAGPSGEDVEPELLFTENDTKAEAVPGDCKEQQRFAKDAFHRYIVNGEKSAVDPAQRGTKCGAWFNFAEAGGVASGECAVVRFRLTKRSDPYLDEEEFDSIIEQRQNEADEFYFRISPLPIPEDLRNIQRQAFATMLWSKQHCHFIWDEWIKGDPSRPAPNRNRISNKQGRHIYLDHVVSVRDPWAYPFMASWDSAFGSVAMAMIDPEFAKRQLSLLTMDNYMQPSGQIPASDCSFDEVSPPVHAWAAFRVFKTERKVYGRQDLDFLEAMLHKLLFNFTWWVNRKDAEGKNIFEGGFLGMDNIRPFDRSAPLPTGGVGVLEQADSTAWMAFYCLTMLNVALELAKYRRVYERLAAKFFEHFILISDAMRNLWNDDDGFYYDAISWGGGWSRQLGVRSLVGLIPLLATLTIEPEMLNKFPEFRRRVEWFNNNRAQLAERNTASIRKRGQGDRLMCSLVSSERLVRILTRLLDEDEFFSPNGIRSLSKRHKEHPYGMTCNGQYFEIGYQPGDSGGKANWRGPIWMAVNFLLIESLQRFYLFYGNGLTIECPTGSGDFIHLARVAEELQHRLQHLFARNDDGRRAINRGQDMLDFDPHWKDYLCFHEFFDGDTGGGLGANHHCGPTALVAKVINDTGVSCRLPQTPRNPALGLALYFDDIFGGHIQHPKPNTPSPRLRRSTTSRSIGHRDDFDVAKGEDWAETAKADTHLVNHVTKMLENHRIGDTKDLEDEIET